MTTLLSVSQLLYLFNGLTSLFLGAEDIYILEFRIKRSFVSSD